MTLWLLPSHPTAFDPSVAGELRGGFAYGIGESTSAALVRWVETSPGSLRFVPVEFSPAEEATALDVTAIVPLGGTPGGHVAPFIVAFDGAQGRSDLYSKEEGHLKARLNGAEAELDTYANEAYPEVEQETYFIVEDGRPKVLVNSPHDLGPLSPAEAADGSLKVTLRKRDSHDDEVWRLLSTSRRVDPPTELPNSPNPPPPTSESDWEQEVEQYFKLLYGPLGAAYLETFTANFGPIDYAHLGYLARKRGYEASHYLFIGGGTPEIRIERDQPPPDAAVALFTALSKFTKHPTFAYQLGASQPLADGTLNEDLANLQKQLFIEASQAAPALTEAYLSGWSFFAYPTEFIFVARDVSNGHHASLAACLPLVPVIVTKAVRYGKAVKMTLPSGNLHVSDKNALMAIVAASAEKTRYERMLILEPHIASGKIDAKAVEVLYESGWLAARGSPSRHLAKNLKATHHGSRKMGEIAHHDFPVEFELKFLQAGFDINHGTFGRWVHRSVHKSWHEAKGVQSGGPFNQVWREFFAEEKFRTRSEILDLLTKIQRGDEFVITRKNLPDLRIRFQWPGFLIPMTKFWAFAVSCGKGGNWRLRGA